MSLIFMDGFDNYNFLPLKWQEYTNGCQIFIKDGVGRNGASGLQFYSGSTLPSDHIGHILDEPLDELIVGFAFKKVKDDAGYIEFTFVDDDTVQNKVSFFNTGFVWNGPDDEYGVDYSLAFDKWNYFEIKVKLHATVGEVSVNVNENNILSVAGINTISTINNYIDRIRFRTMDVSQYNEDYAYIDDLYLCTTSGTINNDFLGNCEVSSYYPNSQGAHSDFELPPTVSGVDNYTMVDERQVNDTTQITDNFYVYSSGDDGCSTGDYGFESDYNELYIERDAWTEDQSAIFIRFSKINIPRHAKIISCKLNVRVDQHFTHTDNGSFCHIGFENKADGVTSPTSLSDIMSRDIDNCSSNYRISNTDLTTKPTNIEMKDFLQELVSKDEWIEEDNSVLYIIDEYMYNISESLDPRISSAFRFRSYDYNNEPTHVDSPTLDVTYEIPSGSPSDDYLHTETLGAKESYNINAVPEGGAILGVATNLMAKNYLDRANPNDMNVTTMIVSSGIDYFGGTLVPSDVYYLNKQHINEVNPETLADWVADDFLTTEFGFTTISG